MVKVNAAAIGLDTAYASITGKSTFITGGGEVGETTDQLVETVLYGSLRFSANPPTLWVRLGDWLAFLAMALGAFGIIAPGTRGSDTVGERGSSSGFAPSGTA
jgi:apolipoprotein N-acyltransferase